MTNPSFEKTDPAEKSLRLSFFKGLFNCCKTGFTNEFFTPFLLFLGGQASHVGIMSALNNICSSLIQLTSAGLVEKLRSRRKTVMLFVSLQALVLAAMAIMAFFHLEYTGLFILLTALFIAFGAVFTPAWLSWLSILVGSKNRGSYFGWRSRNLGLVTVGAMGISGFILQQNQGLRSANGFSLIFVLAFLCTLGSLFFVYRMQEGPYTYNKEDSFSFFQFLSKIKTSNFTKFVFFVSLMSFSVNLAAPFFAVLMLKDLHFNYLTYSIIVIVAPLTLYLNIQRWGHHADQVGNLKILKLTTRLIAIIPFLWIINQNPIYLILVEMFSGFLWAGFNLSTANFIYDAVSPEKRTRCIAYFNVINAAGLSTGALVGGFLIKHLPAIFEYKILTLFLVSSSLRLAVSWIFPGMLKEVRTVKNVHSAELFFSMVRLRPILGDRRNIRA